MYKILQLMEFLTYLLVQDFFHQQYYLGDPWNFQVGFIIAAATGELERGISPLVIFGGAPWFKVGEDMNDL